MLQYWVASLCNQHLLEFSSNHFETLHRCYKHIEDKHVTFSRLQYWVASLCNQLLPEFSSSQFETFYRFYKCIEDVLVTFSRQEIIFDKITAFLT